MSAPWRKEFNDPDAVAVLDAVVEVVRVQVDNAGVRSVEGQHVGSGQDREREEPACRGHFKMFLCVANMQEKIECFEI